MDTETINVDRLPNPLAFLFWRVPFPDPLAWRIPFTADGILVFALVAFCPIQDTLLRGTFLRGVGYNLSSLPLLCIIFLALVRWMWGRRLFTIPTKLANCLLYAFLITIYGFYRFGLTSHGENLILRSFTGGITLALFCAVIFIPKYTAANTRYACFIAFFIMVAGIFFGDIPALHFTPLVDAIVRPRGLSTEPSTLSVTVISVSLLCAHFSLTRMVKVFFVVSAIGLLWMTGSKGGIFVLFICAVVLLALRFRKWYQAPLLLAAVIPLGLFAVSFVPSLFPEENPLLSSSLDTRAVMIVCAAKTVEHNPLGVGFSGFLPAVAAYLPESMDDIQELYPLPLAFNEVSQYLTSAEEVSTKTLFFDEAMRFGLPFIILFAVFSIKLLKRLAIKQNKVLFVGTLAVILALCSYIAVLEYATAILLGVAYRDSLS